MAATIGTGTLGVRVDFTPLEFSAYPKSMICQLVVTYKESMLRTYAQMPTPLLREVMLYIIEFTE